MFFVISGFVITRLLWHELKQEQTVNLRRFFTRRVRRLGPALACMLCTVALASLVLQNPAGSQKVTAQAGVGAALFVANAVLLITAGGYFDLPAAGNPLLHTWTLSVEEQFYLLFPALLLLAWRLAQRYRKSTTQDAVVLGSVAAIFVASLVASIYLTYAHGLPLGGVDHNRRLAFYASPSRAWEFAAGSFLAIVELRLTKLRPRLGPVASWLGLGMVLGAALTFDASTPFPGLSAILPVAGTTLLILGGTGADCTVRKLLSARPMRWMGDRSYGWYLWHWPFIVFTRALVPEAGAGLLTMAAALSLLPTAASYRWVEGPLRANRSIRGRRVLRLTAVCTLLPVAAFAALVGSARLAPLAIRDLVTQHVAHADVLGGCVGNLPITTPGANGCTWNAPGARRGKVVLLGDSNAGHFAEVVRQVAQAHGLSMTLATSGGCPFADVVTRYQLPHGSDGCQAFIATWTREVVLERPVLVVLSNASSEYLRDGNGVAMYSSSEPRKVARSGPDKARMWQAALTRTLTTWAAAGVPTLVVHTVPHFASFDLASCPAFRVVLGQGCGRTLSWRSVAIQRRSAIAAETAAAAAVPGTTTLDLLDAVCPNDPCSTNRGSRWLYRDGAHLTVPFSLTLAGTFDVAFARVLGRDAREP